MTAIIENIDQDTGEITEIALIETDNLVAVFTGDKLESTLDQLEQKVLSVVTDPKTTKGRKEISSLARKVSSSKVALDNAGKTLVSEWKAKSKLVDESRKNMRDRLDDLRDRVNKPVVEWKVEQARREEAAVKLQEWVTAFDEAVIENVLFDREAAIAEKERIATEKEAEKLRVEEEKRLAAEQLERERLLKEQAAEEARLQAQAQIEEAKAREEKLKRDAIEAEVKAKLEKEQAERDRLQAIKDAKEAQEQAVRDAQEQAKREALQVEQQRLEAKREAARQAEAKANNEAHKVKINRQAKESFIKQGFDEEQAKKLVVMIYNKKIKNVTINY